ncbi:MAG TPA: hypothetical protein VEQ58_17190 [Polyangiaceae bacterium]|nr:hypothetical protein [Polyangiaceae bacterium]
MTVRTLLAAAIGISSMIECPLAHADPAAAEALFREGRALLERGEVGPACEKLEASNQLDPSAGTLLNLAACRLKEGKTATAWANFVSAERLATNQSRAEQASEAKRRALELEPQLSTLTLLAPAPPAGLEVRRAGRVVQPASLGSPVPVDPGPMLVEASAPGYETARLEITIGKSADRRVLEIPKLKPVAAAASAGSTPSAEKSPIVRDEAEPGPHAGGALPWVIGGVGGGALIAGGIFGVLALSSDSSATKECGMVGHDAACRSAVDRRDREALASTIGVGVGLVGVGVAAIWLLTGRSGRPASAWSYDGQVTRESALLKMRVGF